MLCALWNEDDAMSGHPQPRTALCEPGKSLFLYFMLRKLLKNLKYWVQDWKGSVLYYSWGKKRGEIIINDSWVTEEQEQIIDVIYKYFSLC